MSFLNLPAAISQVSETTSGFRYWRFNVTAAWDDGATAGSREVEMRDSVGGADITGSGTASALNNAPGSTANGAFDNNFTSRWESASLSSWLQYDFGSPVQILEVSIAVQGSFRGGKNRSFKDFTIESSPDALAWTVRETVVGLDIPTNGASLVLVTG